MRALLLLAWLLLLSACDKDESGAIESGLEEPDVASILIDEPEASDVVPEPELEPEIDQLSSLKMVGDWELVRANCIACHSGKLITQQRGTAQQWLGMIRWMQEKQNLWQFDPETEKKIIDYLAEHYPPGASQRRAALPASMMPTNPYN